MAVGFSHQRQPSPQGSRDIRCWLQHHCLGNRRSGRCRSHSVSVVKLRRSANTYVSPALTLKRPIGGIQTRLLSILDRLVMKMEFLSGQGSTGLWRASWWEVTRLNRRSTEASGLSLDVYRGSMDVGSVGVMWRTRLESLFFQRIDDLVSHSLFIFYNFLASFRLQLELWMHTLLFAWPSYVSFS